MDDDIFSDIGAKKKTDGDIFSDVSPSAPAAPVAMRTEMMEVNSRPRTFGGDPNSAARMTFGQPRTRLVPQEGPIDRGIYQAGGAITDAATKLGLPPEVAAGAGYLGNLGLQVGGTFLGGGLTSKAAPALEAGSRFLMQSSLKPTLDNLRNGNAARAIDTMLKDGYNVTPGGVAAMKAKIAELGDEVATAVQGSTAMINKNAVADRLRDLLDRVSKQVNPGADVNAVQKAWTEFLNHPSLAGRPNIPVQEAQAMKQGTYRELGSKAYGEMGSADIEAQKALARGLKEEIATAVPSVAARNAKQGELLNAAGIAERRVLMDANKNPIGLGILHPETLPLWLWDRSPLAKSLLARALYTGREALTTNAGRMVGGVLSSESGYQP